MRLNELEQKISKTVLGSILGIGVLGSGCVGMERGGEFWGGKPQQPQYANTDSHVEPERETLQSNTSEYKPNSSDANLIATTSDILSAVVPGIGGKLLFGGLGAYSRTEANTLGQKEAVGQIAGAIRQQGKVGSRQDNSPQSNYRVISMPELGTVHIDDNIMKAYGSGFIGYEEYTKRSFRGISAVCTEFRDFNDDGFIDFPDDYIGIGAQRTTAQKTSISLILNRRVSGIRYHLIDNSTGKEISKKVLPEPELNVDQVFSPGELAPGNYSAVWEAGGELLGKIVINVTNP